MRCDVPLRLSHRANLLIIIGKTMIPHLFLLIPYIYCDKHKNHTLRSPNTTDFNIINCRSFSCPKYDYELPFPFFFFSSLVFFSNFSELLFYFVIYIEICRCQTEQQCIRFKTKTPFPFDTDT